MKLTFAVDHTTSGGRTYKGGSTHEVNDQDARALIIRGLARPADTKTTAGPAAEDKPATAGKTEK